LNDATGVPVDSSKVAMLREMAKEEGNQAAEATRHIGMEANSSNFQFV